jgi:hypothetical protein
VERRFDSSDLMAAEHIAQSKVDHLFAERHFLGIGLEVIKIGMARATSMVNCFEICQPEQTLISRREFTFAL